MWKTQGILPTNGLKKPRDRGGVELPGCVNDSTSGIQSLSTTNCIIDYMNNNGGKQMNENEVNLFRDFLQKINVTRKTGTIIKFPNTPEFYGELMKQFKHTNDIVNLKERSDIVFGKYEDLKVIFDSQLAKKIIHAQKLFRIRGK